MTDPIRHPLWASHAGRLDQPNTPWIRAFPADDAQRTGLGILICPGGGYANVEVEREGAQFARWLNAEGIDAFVLRYRVAPARHPAPLDDARRAMRWARQHMAGRGPLRLGAMGFSAGGHLAGTLGVWADDGAPDGPDAVERFSCRPEFLALIYPVITMTVLTHGGSRTNLLGPDPPANVIAALSLEQRVTPQTPPTFLMHTSEDPAVMPDNSILFYQALRRCGVPAEMHIFARGGHGVDMASALPTARHWPMLFLDWLRSTIAVQDGR